MSRPLKRTRPRARPAKPEPAPKAVEIPLKRATVTALLELDQEVKRAQAQYALVSQRMQDRLASILSEHGIAEATIIGVEDEPPHVLRLTVTKFSPKEESHADRT